MDINHFKHVLELYANAKGYELTPLPIRLWQDV